MNVTWTRVLRMEWVKARSLRSTWFTLAGAVVAVIVIGTIIGYATNAHWASVPADERARFEPIGVSLVGVNLAQLIIGVLGVLSSAVSTRPGWSARPSPPCRRGCRS
jgi:hypothetical protein